MKLSFASIAGMVAIAAIAQSAHAGDLGHEGVSTRTVQVAYGDLDLADHTGSKAMLKRLSTAAARACRTGELKHIDFEAIRCRREAVAEAVAQLRSPQVSLSYRAQQERFAARVSADSAA